MNSESLGAPALANASGYFCGFAALLGLQWPRPLAREKRENLPRWILGGIAPMSNGDNHADADQKAQEFDR